MSLLFLYFCFMLVIEQALIAMNKVKTLFYFDLSSLLLITYLIILACQHDAALYDIALYRGLLGLVATRLIFSLISKLIQLNNKRLFILLLSVVVIAMLATLITLQLSLTSYAFPIVNLLASGTAFIFVYSLLFLSFCYFFKENTEIKKLIILLPTKITAWVNLQS